MNPHPNNPVYCLQTNFFDESFSEMFNVRMIVRFSRLTRCRNGRNDNRKEKTKTIRSFIYPNRITLKLTIKGLLITTIKKYTSQL